MIRCGRINYTNDLPVYAAFDAGEVACPAFLIPGVPTTLNGMLLAGDLDVSPISSFYYAQHADAFVLFSGVCIGSRRYVRSIYCLSNVPPAKLSGVPIAVTTESATGRNLFATICASQYGFMPVFVDSADPLAAYRADGSPCLLIGDKAIDGFLAADRENAYDVGELWHAATGRRMVYAVWAARRDVAESFPEEVAAVATALRTALYWGRSHIDRVVAEAQLLVPRPPDFYVDYFQALDFNFDEPAQRGLETFFALATEHGLLRAVPRLEFFDEMAYHA